MDEPTARECISHIRAAAKLCEDAGLYAAWATLLGVADRIVEQADAPLHDRD